MATTQATVDFICEQAGLADRLTARKMFGEYALYVDGKVVALVCDDTLFLKPTTAGRALLGATDERPPYPGAKLHFCVAEQLDDRDLLRQLLLTTADALPAPKAKATPKERATTASKPQVTPAPRKK
ncbi:MAG: TfoX/Sxy family protein [Gemmatimonadaceae bacterium]|nr:TfoX/Sxy family protein [Gemmatimonadaceae bacterium]